MEQDIFNINKCPYVSLIAKNIQCLNEKSCSISFLNLKRMNNLSMKRSFL